MSDRAQTGLELVSQGLKIAGVRVVGTGLGVLVTVLIARLAGAEVLGVYAYCVSLLLLCSVPVSYGWGTMMMRSVARQGALSGTHLVMSRMGILAAVVIASGAGLAAYALVRTGIGGPAATLAPVAVPALAILAVTLLCDQIAALRLATLRGLHRPVVGQVPEMLMRPAVLCGLLLTFWAISGGRLTILASLSALAVAAAGSALAGQLLLRRVVVPPPAQPADRATRRSWIRSATALAGSAGLVQMNGLADMLILAAYAPSEQIGIYRVALQISMLANFGYVALNMLAGPRFSAVIATNDMADLSKSATWLARLALMTSLPVPLILLLAGPGLIISIFGSSFGTAWAPAILISGGFVVSTFVGMPNTLLVMKDREKQILIVTTCALVANLILCLVLIPGYGLMGAAVSNVIANASWNLALWQMARRVTGVDTSVWGSAPKPA